MLLAIRQKTKIRNVFTSSMSTDIKLSKPQIYKIIQSEGFLAVPLGGKKLVPLGLTAAVSAAEAKIQKGIWKRRDK